MNMLCLLIVIAFLFLITKLHHLYFGAGDYGKAIDYLHKIINENQPGLRNDLQCYARLMHLLCHYELGNDEILDSLIKSVYRFMARMKNLTVVEEAIFNFLRHSFKLYAKQLKPELKTFLQKIKHLEKNRFETRSFAYLDIISWVESKVYEKPLEEIIHEKYLKANIEVNFIQLKKFCKKIYLLQCIFWFFIKRKPNHNNRKYDEEAGTATIY